MESDARELMLELERAEAAPDVHYQPTPWWYGLYFGLYAAVLVAAFGWTRDRPWIYFPVIALLLGSVFVVVRHVSRRNGVLPMPGRGNPPPEIDRAYRRYFVGTGVVVVVLLVCWFLLPVVVTVVLALVIVAAGFHLYDRAYDRAAAAVRKRLA